MKNVTNDRQPFGAWWKITEGSLNESDYEPEDKADEGSRSKVDPVNTNTRGHQSKGRVMIGRIPATGYKNEDGPRRAWIRVASRAN